MPTIGPEEAHVAPATPDHSTPPAPRDREFLSACRNPVARKAILKSLDEAQAVIYRKFPEIEASDRREREEKRAQADRDRSRPKRNTAVTELDE